MADIPVVAFYVYALYRDIAMTMPFYIGKGHGDRFKEHERLKERGRRVNHHKNSVIRACIREFGFVPKSILLENLTEDQAFSTERDMIAWWGRRDKGTGCLTNMTDGGEGSAGCVYTVEQNKRNSERLRGRKGSRRPAETRAKIAAALIGRAKTEAHKVALRLANLGKTQSGIARAKNSASNKGHPVTSETREKISMSLVGRVRSLEHCANISNAKRGRAHG
jgi:hypothetical protein